MSNDHFVCYGENILCMWVIGRLLKEISKEVIAIIQVREDGGLNEVIAVKMVQINILGQIQDKV